MFADVTSLNHCFYAIGYTMSSSICKVSFCKAKLLYRTDTSFETASGNECIIGI